MWCTDPLEEQSMEVEALESIFMDDFQLLKSRDDGTPQSFRVFIYPHTVGEGETNYVAASLYVEYSDKYPEEAPNQLQVESHKALLDAQIKELQEVADKSAEENLMMGAMIFNVTEAIKEWLLDNNREPGDGSMHSEMRRRQVEDERKKEKEKEKEELNKIATEEAEERRQRRHGRYGHEEEESRGQHGTPVTVETFAAWRAAFEAEQHKLSPNKRAAGVPPRGDELDLKSSVTGKTFAIFLELRQRCLSLSSLDLQESNTLRTLVKEVTKMKL
eukprot:gb/GECG01009287.1/.p1 GENE.gb/GECG01009287.1/~~gb/GECG01009287.1/.p1  ORF type:complete len:274 (+),score=60.33 gb/GECG01009287.1/:1-822(+)